MDAFTASVIATINARGRVTVGLDNPTDDLRETFSDQIALGTGDDQADEMYHAERTLGGSPDDIDLAGSLTNALGQTITFVDVVMVFIKNAAANSALTIGAAAANPVALWFGDAASDTEEVQDDGWTFHHAPKTGWPVTTGTADILRVAGTSGNKYKIIIIGRTA